ncbi:LOW QUALITY PROTEIN: hypothetical protein T265_15622 [Opisthorchis viverrini]|uniref:Uncharacterized protein n=1 Tax=Opisthorchis viverrini TaxID=6198 RepID=A0A074Z159_OPIVI|nr:LOW QUALITY PROTEIN: hypothetical protein T265_15622 [Opisthorchis viverrini]KER19202.1 LOW QUALITY PROTEIN: hypothetical protein T265_15622 [Opisthorchis viverrini]
MPSEGCTRAGILPGCPSLDRGSRETEVRFEPRAFRSVNSRSNHCCECAREAIILLIAYDHLGMICRRIDKDLAIVLQVAELATYNLHNNKKKQLLRCNTLRCLSAMPSEGCTRAGILPGCPSLDRGSRETEVRFEPRAFRSVNSRSNHCCECAREAIILLIAYDHLGMICRRIDKDLAIVLQLEHEFTGQNIHGSKPTSTFRLGLVDSIPSPVLHSDGMTARHRNGVTAER